MSELGSDYVRAPSGLLLPEYAAQARYAPRRPIAVDFFSGAGGFSLGLVQAGYHVIAGVEWDCIPVITYMANLSRYGDCRMVFIEEGDRERMESTLRREMKRTSKGKKIAPMLTAGSGWISHEPASTPGVNYVFVGDVRKLKGDDMLRVLGMKRGDIDLVVGGPPCQGFSVSGKREVMDPRNSLVFEYARMITELNPKAMVMENVTGIVTMVTPDGLSVIDAFTRILEDGGFSGLDSMKRAIAAQTGSVGILRGKPKEDRPAKRERAPTVDPDQLGLFG